MGEGGSDGEEMRKRGDRWRAELIRMKRFGNLTGEKTKQEGEGGVPEGCGIGRGDFHQGDFLVGGGGD